MIAWKLTATFLIVTFLFGSIIKATEVKKLSDFTAGLILILFLLSLSGFLFCLLYGIWTL